MTSAAIVRMMVNEPRHSPRLPEGLIYGGMPAKRMKTAFEEMNISRIVEVGEPVAGTHPDPTALAVTVKVECGAKKWVQEFAPQILITDNETAAKTVREFFAALTRHDEAAARRALEAGMVFEGFSAKNADKVKELFDQYKVVRLVEVGKPVPYPESKRLEVPVKVELEMKNERVKSFTPHIRFVYNQPDRWEIIGGI